MLYLQELRYRDLSTNLYPMNFSSYISCEITVSNRRVENMFEKYSKTQISMIQNEFINYFEN